MGLLALFGLGLRYFFPNWSSVLALLMPLALITFLPVYRRFVLAISPIALVAMQTVGDPLLLGSRLAVIALGVFLYWCAMRWPNSRFGQRPVAFLLIGFIALLVLAGVVAPHSLPYTVLWGLVAALATYLWFIRLCAHRSKFETIERTHPRVDRLPSDLGFHCHAVSQGRRLSSPH
jgi:hypothetical protein